MRLLLLIFLWSSISFQGYSQTFSGKKKHINKILKNITQFSEHVVNGDYQKIAECYTVDGKIFPNNLEIIEGREKIQKYWTLPEGRKTIAHKVTPTELKIIGKEAYDYGYYEGTTRLDNGEEFSWKGKYVIVWKKVGKDWKIYLDIWNSIK